MTYFTLCISSLLLILDQLSAVLSYLICGIIRILLSTLFLVCWILIEMVPIGRYTFMSYYLISITVLLILSSFISLNCDYNYSMISSDARTCSDQYSLFTRYVSLSADRSQDSADNTEEKEINMKAVRSSKRTKRESEGPGSASSCDVPYAKVARDKMS